MNKPNLLQKATPLGIVTLGTISILGIATTPVIAGSLNFEDGTSDFLQFFAGIDLNDVAGTAPDNFMVTFSPDNSQNPPNDNLGSVLISNANGEFVPAFNSSPPSNLAWLTPAIGNFNIADDPATSNVVEYTINGSGLRFDFPAAGSPLSNPSQNVTVFIDPGSVFGVEVNGDVGGFIEGIAVELLETEGDDFVNIGGVNYPCCQIPDGNSLDGIALTFDQAAGDNLGDYSGSVTVSSHDVTTPEPTTILGILTIGGLGLSLKRKKKLLEVG